MSEKMEKDIKWMYEGPKSLVNREDYLLGKKIDKNFELFSDVVIKEKEETSERFTRTILADPSNNASTSSVAILGLDIVRTEDPLVAIRMQKEQRKRAILEDPLLKLKTQRILREAYEKELNEKKHKKKKSKRKRSSSSSAERSKHHVREEKREYREARKRKRSRSSCRDERRRHEHTDRRSFHHDDTQKKHSSRRDNDSRKASPVPQSRQNEQKSKTQRLSKEEMETRRQMMMSNMKWRDEIRDKTIENAASKLRSEEAELDNTKCGAAVASLIKNVTTASSSVQQRLQSKRHTLQSSHNYMEKSFVRK